MLVIDDNASFRHALCAVIAATPGFDVFGASPDGARGLDLVIRDKPDLVLADVQMPGFDGFETARRIRGLHPDVVVVLLTVQSATAGMSRGDVPFVIEDKRNVSSPWLVDVWRRHGHRP